MEGNFIRHMNSKNIVAAMIDLAFMTVFGVSSSQAQATVFHTNDDIPTAATLFACTENIIFSGKMHVVIHSSFEPSGSFQIVFMTNYQDVQGIGESTGSKYRITGLVDRLTFTMSQPQFEQTIMSESNVVSQGPGDNFRLSLLIHFTIAA